MGWREFNINTTEFQEALNRLDAKQAKIAKARPLPSIAMIKIKESLNVEWTYNSNSIEGNTLTLQETKMVIEEGITVKGKSLREHFETVNHQEAIEYIYSLAKPGYKISEQDVLEAHSLVLNKIEKDFAGRFRNAGVRITGANFVPPNALKVHDLFEELIHWVNSEAKNLHPVVAATIFHHRFVWIHPFFDGNGRTVRLVFNLLLMKEGFPPAIILKNDRKKYYDALNKANSGDYSKLLLLVIQALDRTLTIYLNTVDNNGEEYLPINSMVLEDNVPYGQEYISLLARRGKIDAYKEGRVWYTTEKAVKNYISTRKRNRDISKGE